MKKLLVIVATCIACFVHSNDPIQAPAARPKLGVLLVDDQMRGDYPVRYASLLQHGLKRLTTEGAWYKNGAYPYLTTVTCVGHSTIGTGTFPYKHGMIAH